MAFFHRLPALLVAALPLAGCGSDRATTAAAADRPAAPGPAPAAPGGQPAGRVALRPADKVYRMEVERRKAAARRRAAMRRALEELLGKKPNQKE